MYLLSTQQNRQPAFEVPGLTTGVAEMVGSIPPALLIAVSPNWPPAGDFSLYSVVDVRQVTFSPRGVVVQIIIAYKGDKTPEVEAEAMVRKRLEPWLRPIRRSKLFSGRVR